MKELEESAKHTKPGRWNKDAIVNLIPKSPIRCISDRKVKKWQKTESWHPTLYTVSQPIFDKSRTHCVVNVISSRHKSQFIFSSYFLVKIYGKWIIVERFGLGMT